MRTSVKSLVWNLTLSLFRWTVWSKFAVTKLVVVIPNPGDPRATAASIPIIIYMDDVRLGEPSSLTNIPASRVKEIRFMNARDATTRYGTGHSSGVILVLTKR